MACLCRQTKDLISICVLVQPMAEISRVMDQWTEALQINQAQLREAVCRRYHPIDLSKAEQADLEDGTEVRAEENEDYLMEFQLAR